jgi:hypothetical protein
VAISPVLFFVFIALFGTRLVFSRLAAALLIQPAMTGRLANSIAFERIFRSNTSAEPLRKNCVCVPMLVVKYAAARFCARFKVCQND